MEDAIAAQLTARVNELPLIGPVKFTLTLYLTNGFRTATTTYTLPLGQLPTEAAVRLARRECLDRAAKQLGGFSWRELTRDKFVAQVAREAALK